MYKAFYSLAAAPFAKEVGADQAFPSAASQETAAALAYLKTTRGMGLIVGEPGAGKTYALRGFSQSLNPALYKVIYFPPLHRHGERFLPRAGVWFGRGAQDAQGRSVPPNSAGRDDFVSRAKSDAGVHFG